MKEGKEIIILIGPIRAGKSTIANLLSEKLNYPRFRMDILRYEYYKEIDYNEEKAEKIKQEHGFIALVNYWKPFDVHAVKRVLQDCDFGIIDFGGGLSVYKDERLLAEVIKELEPYKNVILLLPSENNEESINLLNSRMEEKEYKEYFQIAGINDRINLNKHFIEHPSNKSIAKHIFYTKGKSPEQTCNEIIDTLNL